MASWKQDEPPLAENDKKLVKTEGILFNQAVIFDLYEASSKNGTDNMIMALLCYAEWLGVSVTYELVY